MKNKRIIPCLDIKDGKTVKGVHFENIKTVGDPVEMAKHYEEAGADELVLLDISATIEGRKTFVDLVEKVSKAIEIPFAVGGGITSIEDAEKLLNAGASKVSINSAAVLNPQLINDLSGNFGSKAIVIAIDARTVDGVWKVTTHGGTRTTEKDLFSWAKEVEERGAGEILFTSMDHDGTKKGYPCDVYKKLSDAISIPIIASGGAGSAEHIIEVLTAGGASAALAASIFHYGEVIIPELKETLKKRGVL